MGGNGNNGNGRRNRRVIPGVTADTLLGDVAKRVYTAALAQGRNKDNTSALAELAPLAGLGIELHKERLLELQSTCLTLKMLFDLTDPAVDLLLFSLAAELDERIYAAAMQLTATVQGSGGPRVGGLLSLLYPDLIERETAHQALREDAPLIRYKMVRLLGPRNAPVSQGELCAEPSLLPHIVIHDGAKASPPAPALAGVGTVVGPADAKDVDGVMPGDLGHRLDLLQSDVSSARVLHLHLQTTKIVESIARRIAAHTDRPVVVLDVRAVAEHYEDKVAVALRESRLRNGLAMFVNPMSMGDTEDKPQIRRSNAQRWRRMLAGERRLVVLASEGGEAADVDLLATVGLDLSVYEFPTLTMAQRKEVFDFALDRARKEQPGDVPQLTVASDISTQYLAAVHRVTEAEIPAIISQAAADARLRTLVDGHAAVLTVDDVKRAAREKTHRDVGKFARLVTSRYQWDDLVLPPDIQAQLWDIYVSAKKRAFVYEEWGYSRKHIRGLSLAMLFSGESGTGKTMAAEVLANALGLNLYQVDIASVVSKWIGETERHLSEIFDATENSDSILFFDEADALFGKRTEVNESKDRYANIEVSYLLQRIESYGGIVILSSNFRSNVDPAFLRRIQFGMQFPMPDAEARSRIWRGVFPDKVPLDGVDFDVLAHDFADLSGGQIRLIAVGAAMLAAGEDKAVAMSHVRRAYTTERLKMLRVVSGEPNRAPTDVNHAVSLLNRSLS